MASAESDLLPSYNTLFPEDAANTVINGRRRYTTITLREIYYPGGCPCHPKEKNHDKKGKQKQPTQPPPNQFSGSLNDTRGLFSLEFPQQQHIRRFEILKSTALGLVFPQNLKLEVIDVDLGIARTGHSTSLESGRPVFETGIMKWWKEKYMLPPAFEIFPSHPKRHQKDPLQSNEIIGLPPSPPPPHDSLAKFNSRPDQEAEKPYPLAQIKYPGWQGISRMSIDLTLYNITPAMHYDHNLHQLADRLDLDIRSRWVVTRIGWKREYMMYNPAGTRMYKWRRSANTLTLPGVEDGHPRAHGNLQLEESDGRIVAVYKQRRDFRVLGALSLFMDVVKAPMTVEAVVASCLAIVLYERLGWQNLLGQ
ncbi:uncharacterized protein Z518_08374 [Rhinocladiella mackenziei CBS 650.93]|uniref:Rhinocladiella mackenziei CBS 650.93 unplaced genomic scaffold supercont1.6, whole genome shotgun sequence n=1 Tax=Rhinocladiella mackenziei CBS 650.93 TaxID=1442369 RepID=A0A0D2GW07_9EURO|nr:uncharacterized protein Z518_08374 [Rhinocladiella mackenziei CBS 650.93]KIX02433.1 hypothetical protein Z518_08374 [Rhinocladiella mackenziei CBS 650.93]